MQPAIQGKPGSARTPFRIFADQHLDLAVVVGCLVVVDELQRVQAQLKWLKLVSGIIVVAIGVLIALSIAHLWR